LDEILQQPYTMIVRDTKKQCIIIGVSMNDMYIRGQREYPIKAQVEENTHPNVYVNGQLIETLLSGVNFFDIFKTDRVFHQLRGAVRPGYKKLGIAAKVLRIALQYGIDLGAGVAFSTAVNAHSAHLSSRLGYLPIGEINYADFEYKGRKPYAELVTTIHKKVTLFVWSPRISKTISSTLPRQIQSNL